jgi:hypothetical protein
MYSAALFRWPHSKTRISVLALLPLQALLEGKNMKFRPKQKTASQAWKQIMSVKTTVIEAIVRHGYDVFVMDADTVLLHNPLDYVGERRDGCDYQWQADGKDKFLLGMSVVHLRPTMAAVNGL